MTWVSEILEEEKVRMCDICDLSAEMSAVLRVSRIFCLAPLRFVEEGRGTAVTISRRYTIFGYVFVVLYGIFNMSIFLLEILHNELDKIQVKFSIIFWTIIRMTAFLLVLLIVAKAVLGAPRRMKNYMSYMKTIQEIQMNLKKRSISNPWIARIIMAYTMFGFIIIMIIDSIMSVFKMEWDEFSFAVSARLTNFLVILLPFACHQLTFIMAMILSTTRAINSDLSSSRTNDSVAPHEIIRQYYILSNSLCELILNVNTKEGGLLFALFVQKFFNISTTIFHVGFSIGKGAVPFLIIQVLWLVYHLSQLFIVVESCHRVEKEMEETKFILCKILASAPSDKLLVREATRYLERLSLVDDVFSPYGIFSLTRSFSVKVISAITTGVVVLIQFKMFVV